MFEEAAWSKGRLPIRHNQAPAGSTGLLGAAHWPAEVPGLGVFQNGNPLINKASSLLLSFCL